MVEKKEKHVHKFKRHVHKSGTAVLFCALPDCSAKINPSLALGKRSICWRCGNEFILNEYSLRLAKPHCEKCHKPKNAKDVIPIIPFIQSETNAVLKDSLSISERFNKALGIPTSTIDSTSGEAEAEDEDI